MELFPLFVLFCSYFAERLFGFRLKKKLLERANPLPSSLFQRGFSPFYIAGILLSIAGILFHNLYFYSYWFSSLPFFLLFFFAFIFFLNTNLYRDFSQSLFRKALKREPEEVLLAEGNRLRHYVASALPIEGNQCYPHVFVLTVSLLLETIIAPIFLFLVGGYLLFGLYFLLYLLLVVFRQRNQFLLELYRGFLFIPALFSLVIFTFSAFAAGRSFGKVTLATISNMQECFAGFDRLLLLNVRAMVATLEITLTFRYEAKDYSMAYGEEKLNQRTFVLTQRLLGIQKFLTYIFSYYLYIVL